MKAEPGLEILAPDELRIELLPFDMPMWEIQGTSAQLRAEGLIPAGVELPVGVAVLQWDSGRFRHRLSRTRKAGLRGPMRVWTEGDWWSFQCWLIGAEVWDIKARRLVAAQEELRRRSSPAGQACCRSNWEAFEKARKDKAFQRFKAGVAGRTGGRQRAGAASSGFTKGSPA